MQLLPTMHLHLPLLIVWLVQQAYLALIGVVVKHGHQMVVNSQMEAFPSAHFLLVNTNLKSPMAHGIVLGVTVR